MRQKTNSRAFFGLVLPGDHPATDFDPQKYRPRCAKDAEKLRLLGATHEELRKWFGVHEFFLDKWASDHEDFARALQVEPITTLGIIEDFGLINWLKDYRVGNLGA